MTSLGYRGCVMVAACAIASVWASGCGSSGDGDGSGSGDLGTAGTAGSGAGTGSGASGSGASTGAAGVGAGTGSGATTGAGASGVGGFGGGTGGAGAIVQDLCGTEGCECSNGIDDDGDGFIDGFDEECTGPFDNDEGTFATGISGDNKDPKWQDCFFDGNSGAGDDDCRYHTDCLTGDLPADDSSCTVSDLCLEMCAPRTPNGCDCFGCCEVSDSSGARINVYLSETCSSETIDDETVCPRCTPSTQCGNTCGECELCLGKTVEDLPESCQVDAPPPVSDGGTAEPPPPIYTCEGGEQVCGEGQPDCPVNYYCQLGCCQVVIR